MEIAETQPDVWWAVEYKSPSDEHKTILVNGVTGSVAGPNSVHASFEPAYQETHEWAADSELYGMAA
jgi:hypothetical protein